MSKSLLILFLLVFSVEYLFSEPQSADNKIGAFQGISPECLDKASDSALKKALILFENAKDDSTRAVALREAGKSCFRFGKFQSSMAYLNHALSIFEQYKHKTEIALTFKEFAKVYIKLAAYSKALTYLFDAKEYFVETKDSAGLSSTLMNIGATYMLSGQYEKALENYKETLTIARKISNAKIIAKTMNNIGLVYYKKKEYDKALEYFAKSIYILKDSLYENTGAEYLNIGHVYEETNMPRKALEYFLKANKEYKKYQNLFGVANSHNKAGNIYAILKNYDKAFEHLTFGHEMSKRLGVLNLRSESNKYMINYYKAVNKPDSALKYYDLLLIQQDSLHKIDSKNNLESYTLSTNIEKQNNEIEKYKSNLELSELKSANQTYFIYFLIFSSVTLLAIAIIAIIRNRNKKRVNEILTEKNKIIIEQKDRTQATLKELQIIQKEQNNLIKELNNSKMTIEHDANKLLKLNIGMKETEKELRRLNATKDKFFSIIAHDLRSPLGSFKNMTELLSDSFDELSGEEIKSLIYELRNSSSHVYNLLENLLTWSRSQRGAIEYNPESLDLYYIASNNLVLLKMNAAKKKIKLISDIEEKTFVFADINSINTILRNLISNAIKFTHENGEIVLSALKNNGRYEISVKDNGTGMSKETMNKLFKIEENVTTIGTSNERGTGLGLILCKEFAENNGGKIWVNSRINHGSVFTFSLPVAE